MKNLDCNSLCNLAQKIILGFLSAGVISIKPCFAQSTITPDNTLGTEASQVTPNVDNPDGIKSELIEGGAQRGQNLFHSFQEFNVTEGQGAYFLVPNDTIQNVLTRVTGTNRSEISGVLGTTSSRDFAPTDANLFLMNPNGIVFGRNASLDVEGSFFATTASAISLGGQGYFSATQPQQSNLLSVSPGALFFNQAAAQPGNIINTIEVRGANLQVNSGQILALIGGNVSMEGGQLSADGGQVELGGLAAPGIVEMKIDSFGKIQNLSFPVEVQRADVTLTSGAQVLVTAAKLNNCIK